MKAIRQAQTREILDAYNREDISYSRMNEMFNELAEKFAIKFTEWLNEIQSFNSGENAYFFCGKWYDYKQILEIYKKEEL